MLIKVVAVQARMGHPLSLEEKLHIFKQRPDYVCLPEYWVLREGIGDFHRAALDRSEYLEQLAQLSDELDTILIGGSLVEPRGDGLYNTAVVFDRGQLVNRYRKINPVPGEAAAGICSGKDYVAFDVGPARIGLLLCGDVFYPDNYHSLGQMNPDIIFVPTTSPYRPDDSVSARRRRDKEYFLDGAKAAGAYVVKVCGVGKFMNKPLQGRSLITAPWEAVKQVSSASENSPRIITATFDLDELREFRQRLNRSSESRVSPSA